MVILVEAPRIRRTRIPHLKKQDANCEAIHAKLGGNDTGLLTFPRQPVNLSRFRPLPWDTPAIVVAGLEVHGVAIDFLASLRPLSVIRAIPSL